MVISHDDADDLLQEVFIKIFKNIDKFREDAQLYTWIYKIATNECLAFLKRKRRAFFLPIVDIQEQLSNQLDNSPISGDEIQLKLQKFLMTKVAAIQPAFQFLERTFLLLMVIHSKKQL